MKRIKTTNVFIIAISGEEVNPFKSEFTIVIFIYYKPRIAVAILDLQWIRWFDVV